MQDLTPHEPLSLKEAAERVGVTPATLRRWAQAGVIPGVNANGGWTRAAVAHARIVARLRQRGHTLAHQLCRATLREEP
jgi:adenylate cyclase